MTEEEQEKLARLTYAYGLLVAQGLEPMPNCECKGPPGQPVDMSKMSVPVGALP